MKKSAVILSVSVLLAFVLTGCGKEKEIDGSLADIMEKIYAGSGLTEDDLPRALNNIEVDEQNIANFIGTADLEFTEALASEPMIGSIAHSVVLVRIPADADIEAAEKLVRDNANPAKWICAQVDESDVIVDHIGHTLVLIMSKDAKALDESFRKLGE